MTLDSSTSGTRAFFVPSPLGDLVVVVSPRGIRTLALPAAGGREATLWYALGKEPLLDPHAVLEAPPSAELLQVIAKGLEGDRDALEAWSSLPIDITGLPSFRAKVYEATRRIPPGGTVTYGDLALKIGAPGSVRAVGQALAENPVPLVVPCHRVVAKGGSLTGFSAPGGTETKGHLLALERAAISGLPWVPVRPPTPKPIAGAPTWAGTEAPPYDVVAACRVLAASDPILARALSAFGGVDLRFRRSTSTFEALARSIVYQQLSGKAAETIHRRLVAICSGEGPLEASDVRKVPDEGLRAAGLSGSKMASLRDLAERERRGELPTLRELGRLDDEAVIEALTKVRGIGRWSAEVFLLFRLGRPDVLPLGDLGIKKGFLQLFTPRAELLPTEDVIARRAERWRPYRSVASLLLWRVLDANAG